MAEKGLDWEAGLPSGDDLTPMSQALVPPELAAAFSIPPADHKSKLDLDFAAHNTIFTLTRSPSSMPLSPSRDDDDDVCPMVLEEDESLPPGNSRREAILRQDFGVEENSDRALKRPRLVWTPQLHRRFVDVVSYIGVKNMVPKTIMQLMNVEGLTRENVASHLQKYRLYLKRMQGILSEDPSNHLSASTPVRQGLHEHRRKQPQRMPVPVIPMTIYSMPNRHAYGVVPLHNHQDGMQYNWPADFFQDLQAEFQNWEAGINSQEKPKSLWEELADIGEEFVEFLEKELNINDSGTEAEKDPLWENSNPGMEKEQGRDEFQAEGNIENSIDEIEATLAQLKKNLGL